MKLRGYLQFVCAQVVSNYQCQKGKLFSPDSTMYIDQLPNKQGRPLMDNKRHLPSFPSSFYNIFIDIM